MISARPPFPPAPPPRRAATLWRLLAEAQDVALAAEEVARATTTPGASEPRASISAGAPAAGASSFAGGASATRGRRSRGGRRPALAVTAAATAVAVAAAVALFVAIPRGPTTLSVRVGSASDPAAAPVPSLVADARADLPLRFSDGSAVTFRAGSAGRLASLSGTGAEVVLERGALEAHVVHTASTAWIVRAGPYRVRVTGTRFSVAWQADSLDLILYEGSVTVDGATLGAGVPLQAGRRLTVASGVVRIEPFRAALATSAPARTGASGDREHDRAASRTLARLETAPVPGLLRGGAPGRGETIGGAESDDVGEDDSVGAARPLVGTSASGSPAGTADSRGRHGPRGAPGRPDADWVALAERGRYPEALASARHLGWSNLCRRLDARRLLTLADVARYSGARAPARRAFEALARRFPHDRLAGDAVFSLGKMAFEAGRPAEAARWFHRYGADWPNGPLGDEAAGRLVESTIRLDDTTAARTAARAYLARAPHGAQAPLARSVLADPTDGGP